MKYKKGTFTTVPNVQYLKSKPSILQTLFLWICIHADDDGVCYPSRKLLATECDCDIRTIDKYIKLLEEDGCLIKTKRRKTNSKENSSNLYQIMIVGGSETIPLPSEHESTTPSEPNDTVTIPNTNYTQITKVVSNDTENNVLVRRREVGELPDRFGTTPTLRFLDIYKKLYSKKFGISYKENNIVLTRVKVKKFLSDKTEEQAIALLYIFFHWKGGAGDDDRAYKYFSDRFFPLDLFYANENGFIAYFINTLKRDYSDPIVIHKYLIDTMIDILGKK